MSESVPRKEGWWFPTNSKKAHYIFDHRSLCGAWGYLGSGSSLEEHKSWSPDDCKVCQQKLAKLKGIALPNTPKYQCPVCGFKLKKHRAHSVKGVPCPGQHQDFVEAKA